MGLLPIHDRNPRLNIRFHYVTIALIVANAAVFFHQLGLGDYAVRLLFVGFGLVPALMFGSEQLPTDIAQVPPIASLVTYQFLHGGWGHLLFNMLYLWVFGDNIEDSMGHVRFLVFFLICGVLAGLLQAVIEPGATSPIIGASGAISGVLGAYLVLHPHVRIWTLAFGFIPVRLPALLVLGVFFAQNLLFAAFAETQGAGVAFWAHIGGFVAGAGLIAVFRYGHVKLWHRPPSPWK